MKLRHVQAAGFRGIRSEISIPIPDGFLVITGRNGSGKSTLLDAVEFALTGGISRPALSPENREDINSYIWWRGENRPSSRFVKLAFDLHDSTRLEVLRRPEGVEFRVFGQDGSSDAVTGSTLKKLFSGETGPKDHTLARLCRSTIVRDEQITELSVDAPEASRFSLVSDTLGSTLLPDIAGQLGKAKEIISLRVKLREREYETARADVTRLLSQLSEARSEFDEEPDAEAARRDLVTALKLTDGSDTDSLSRQARKRVGRLRVHIATLSRCIPRINELQRQLTEIETEAYRVKERALNRELARASEAKERAQEALRAAEMVVQQFEGAEPRIRSLAELLEHGKRIGLEDERCPLCGSNVTTESFALHLRETAEHVAHESQGLSDALARREEALRADRLAESQKQHADKEAREHRRIGDSLRDEFSQVVAEVRGMEGLEIPVKVNEATLEATLLAVRSALEPIESAVNTLGMSTAYTRMVEQERALLQARERLAVAQNSLEAAQRAKAHLVEATRAVKRVAGELVDERLAQLEPLLVELYGRLRPHVQWSTVGYRIRGDVKRFMRLTVGEEEVNPRFMFSSGQRRALGLAFLLSMHLSTTWSKWNTLILDDPMQHVDDYRALHLVEVLSSIRRSGRQILCAVEDRSLADLLARRMATSESENGCMVQLKYEIDDGSKVAAIDRLPPLAPRLFSAA